MDAPEGTTVATAAFFVAGASLPAVGTSRPAQEGDLSLRGHGGGIADDLADSPAQLVVSPADQQPPTAAGRGRQRRRLRRGRRRVPRP